MDKRYLTCAETAKLLRKALVKEFPGQKFYVNSDTYAGGASINVDWIDGPSGREVKAVTDRFEGADFDGSIDLKCYWYHWLMPDGSVKLAKGGGTEGSRGYIRGQDNPKPHPDAELVSLGADFIHTNRSFSPEFLAKVAEEYSTKTGWEAPEIKETNWYAGRKSRPGAAYYVQDYEKKAPGSRELLAWEFNRQAYKVSAYEKPKAKVEKATSKPVSSDNGNSNGKPKVEVDRDWVWVYFPDKPGENTLNSLRSLRVHYGGGFSGKRKGWYFKSLKAKDHVKDIVSTWQH